MTDQQNEQLQANMLEYLVDTDIEELMAKLVLFHDYSLANTYMICSQIPYATHVAGYKTWLQLGRHVTKGQHAIKIWAPILVTDRDDPDKKLLRFRTVPVFDISQTTVFDESLSIPQIQWHDHPEDQLTGPAADLIPAITQAATNGGVTVSLIPIESWPHGSQVLGLYNNNKHIIDLQIDQAKPLATLHNTAILCHEYAHQLTYSLIESLEADKQPEGFHDRNWKEAVAELATLKYLAKFGLDIRQHSLAYVTWFKTYKELIPEAVKWADKVTKALDNTIQLKTEQEVAA